MRISSSMGMFKYSCTPPQKKRFVRPEALPPRHMWRPLACWRWYKCLLHTTDYRLSLSRCITQSQVTHRVGRGGGLSLTLHYSAERRVSSHPHSAASDSGDKENTQTFSNHSFALQYSHLNLSFVTEIYTIMYFYWRHYKATLWRLYKIDFTPQQHPEHVSLRCWKHAMTVS